MTHTSTRTGAALRRPVVVPALVLALALCRPGDVRGQDPAVVYIGTLAVAAALPSFLMDRPQPDARRSLLKLSFGHFDTVDDENTALELQVEYHPGRTWHRLKPLVGAAWNSDGSVYGWTAASLDLHVADRFVLSVNTGPALYLVGEVAKDLGSPVVLRSGFEVGYRFGPGARVTGSFHHMSHGKLLNPRSNPGTEVVAASVWWVVN